MRNVMSAALILAAQTEMRQALDKQFRKQGGDRMGRVKAKIRAKRKLAGKRNRKR
jgi:hypothetical protein